MKINDENIANEIMDLMEELRNSKVRVNLKKINKK